MRTETIEMPLVAFIVLCVLLAMIAVSALATAPARRDAGSPSSPATVEPIQ